MNLERFDELEFGSGDDGSASAMNAKHPNPTPTHLPLSLPLHHLDALSSNQTPSQLFHLRLRRDSLHFNSLAYNRTRPGPPSSGFSSSIVSGLSQGSGEYFTRIDDGSPPKYLYMVLDTGSDVVWLQCAPCKHCYSQTDPVFDPRKSSSFSSLPCSSPLYRHLDSPGCSSKSKTCLYQVSYGNDSFTFGDLSTETLTFRRSKVPKVALGCGHDNEGLFVGAAGEACRRTCKAGEHRARLTKLVSSWF
ncbi:PREDICTED: protein ASPARTIC PROTEASE IN GUARD CELL 1-like [Fragaria vesca subsp. vesca]